jgi:nucleotide-binding universal stress UspA family protein
VIRFLDEVADRIRSEGVEVETRVMAGAVAAAIESVTQPGDLIVMTSHGRGGIRRWIIGSVAEQLVRTATVPVLLVPAM